MTSPHYLDYHRPSTTPGIHGAQWSGSVNIQGDSTQWVEIWLLSTSTWKNTLKVLPPSDNIPLVKTFKSSMIQATNIKKRTIYTVSITYEIMNAVAVGECLKQRSAELAKQCNVSLSKGISYESVQFLGSPCTPR